MSIAEVKTKKSPPVYGGGELVQLEAPVSAHQSQLDQCKRLRISLLEMFDLYLLGIGAYSPLQGFMNSADYRSVVHQMTLDSGLTWSIPITLSAPEATANTFTLGETIVLEIEEGLPVGMIELQEVYQPDRQEEARHVYRTDSLEHPGVKGLFQRGDVYLAGPVKVFSDNIDFEAKADHAPPKETRAMFLEKGWSTVVAFQTRNPIHRAHEYLQKCALEMVDGLFIHPLMGETKPDDIPADVRMACYKELISGYYNQERVQLGVYPAAMRYAGPREAILHAIVRQNYGCTHFIVGRDHAGVGDYYGTYDAQTIFDEIDASHLAITPLKFEHSFYCNRCCQMVSSKTCPHPSSDHVFLSGTKVRDMLTKGEPIPPEFTRQEIATILRRHYEQ